MMAMSTALAVAQNTGAPQRGTLEAAITYNAVRADAITGKSFWMQGGSAQLHGQFYGGLGAVADVAGMHVSNINGSGVGLDLVTATFGPRYTWARPHAKYALYAQALAGLAIGFNSVFPSPTGANTTGYNLAVKVGGGMNYALSPHVALRAFEADWLRTELPNSTTGVQNNLTLGAGVVFRFK
jgi:hypothetical protein